MYGALYVSVCACMCMCMYIYMCVYMYVYVYASRAFRNAAPVVWNNLPHHLTDDLSCPASFRRNLKTHLFRKSFRH